MSNAKSYFGGGEYIGEHEQVKRHYGRKRDNRENACREDEHFLQCILQENGEKKIQQ